MTLRMKERHRVFRNVFVFALIGLAMLSANIVWAGSITLIKPPEITPDMMTSYDDVKYDATTGLCVLTAYSQSGPCIDNTHFVVQGDGMDPDLHVFTISMHIDPLTGMPTDGSLDIAGHFMLSDPDPLSTTGYLPDDYLGLSSTDQPLLTGSINKLEFDGSGEEAELAFVFDVTGGALQRPGVYPAQVGILLHQSLFAGDWNTSFESYSAYSDMFPVPEPAGWMLLSTLPLGGGIVFWRRRRAS